MFKITKHWYKEEGGEGAEEVVRKDTYDEILVEAEKIGNPWMLFTREPIKLGFDSRRQGDKYLYILKEFTE